MRGTGPRDRGAPGPFGPCRLEPGSYDVDVHDRWFGRAGAFAWAMVGVPMLIEPELPPSRLAVWCLAYAAFGAAAWISTRRQRPPIPLLALEVACVFTMVVILCNGFEVALLVLVAMQLARRAPPPGGWVWIGAQSVLIAVGITVHWSLRPALLLVPPYLGLQVLGYAMLRLLDRIEAAGRAEERLRIARDLHDALGHHLTALSLNLEVAAHTIDGDAAPPVRTAQSIAKLLLADVRDVVSALHSDEPIDLAAALRRMAADIPTPRVHLDLPPALHANAERSHVVLRCAQEMITNAARHAHARNLWLDVCEHGDGLRIRARDDGAGTADSPDGHGLRGMRTRLEELGGTLSISTRPGAGFVVVVNVPPGRE
jgi:signal transduction histidine kinase